MANKDLLNQLLNPIHKNIVETVLKKQKQQVEEAMDSGMTAEQLLKSANIPIESLSGQQNVKPNTSQSANVQDPFKAPEGLPFNQEDMQVAQPQQVLQAPQQQGQIQQSDVPKIRQILGGLIRQSAASRNLDLQNVLLEQEIKGERKPQPIDIMKQKAESFKSAAQALEEGRLKPNELFSKFETASKEYNDVRSAFNRVNASVENPSAAGDLSLIFNYMKMLDPDSVVRESEFAAAASSGSFGQRFIAAGKKLLKGERLSDEMRQDFYDRAKKLNEAAQKTQKETIDQFADLAKKNLIDPSNILRQNTQTLPRTQGVTSSGNKYRRK